MNPPFFFHSWTPNSSDGRRRVFYPLRKTEVTEYVCSVPVTWFDICHAFRKAYLFELIYIKTENVTENKPQGHPANTVWRQKQLFCLYIIKKAYHHHYYLGELVKYETLFSFFLFLSHSFVFFFLLSLFSSLFFPSIWCYHNIHGLSWPVGSPRTTAHHSW